MSETLDDGRINHDALDKSASIESATKASDMELRPGNEVAIGGSVYRIIDITTDSVKARKIVDDGIFQLKGADVYLDMRLEGWKVISKATGHPYPGFRDKGMSGPIEI